MSGDTQVIPITNGAMRWLTRRREQHAGRLPQLEKRNATTLAERDTSHPYICSRSPSPPGTDRPTRKPRPETPRTTEQGLPTGNARDFNPFEHQEVQHADAATGGIHRHPHTHTQRSRI